MEKILRIIQELQDNGKVKMYVVEYNLKTPKVVPIEFECVKIFSKTIYAYLPKTNYREEQLYNINECYFTDGEAREKIRKIIEDEIRQLKMLLIRNNASVI